MEFLTNSRDGRIPRIDFPLIRDKDREWRQILHSRDKLHLDGSRPPLTTSNTEKENMQASLLSFILSWMVNSTNDNNNNFGLNKKKV